MTDYRKTLADRLIRLYGFESDIVIAFCEYCDMVADNEWNDHLLTILVEAHEAEPYMPEEED